VADRDDLVFGVEGGGVGDVEDGVVVVEVNLFMAVVCGLDGGAEGVEEVGDVGPLDVHGDGVLEDLFEGALVAVAHGGCSCVGDATQRL